MYVRDSALHKRSNIALSSGTDAAAVFIATVSSVRCVGYVVYVALAISISDSVSMLIRVLCVFCRIRNTNEEHLLHSFQLFDIN